MNQPLSQDPLSRFADLLSSARKAARVSMAASVVVGTLSLVSAALVAAQCGALPVTTGAAWTLPGDAVLGFVGIVHSLVNWFGTFFFFLWLARSWNAASLVRGAALPVSAALAVLLWFVPVGGVVLSALVLRALVRASDPALSSEPSSLTASGPGATYRVVPTSSPSSLAAPPVVTFCVLATVAVVLLLGASTARGIALAHHEVPSVWQALLLASHLLAGAVEALQIFVLWRFVRRQGEQLRLWRALGSAAA